MSYFTLWFALAWKSFKGNQLVYNFEEWRSMKVTQDNRVLFGKRMQWFTLCISHHGFTFHILHGWRWTVKVNQGELGVYIFTRTNQLEQGEGSIELFQNVVYNFIQIKQGWEAIMLSLVLAGIILTVLCIWIAWKRVQLCQIISQLPGPKSWPVVGNALQLKRDPHGMTCFIIR